MKIHPTKDWFDSRAHLEKGHSIEARSHPATGSAVRVPEKGQVIECEGKVLTVDYVEGQWVGYCVKQGARVLSVDSCHVENWARYVEAAIAKGARYVEPQNVEAERP